MDETKRPYRFLTAKELAEVAAVYKANPGRGTLAVQKHWNIHRRSAGVWVRKCRDAGLLPPTGAGRDEALRELLSYCRTESAAADEEDGRHVAYYDVANRLAAILDGES